MDYQETLHYLYAQLPMFHRIGAAAYKNSLDNTLALDQLFNHPHQRFKTIHVAGTNGKGSVSHSLAAILQCAGYKVGLYTSPHLIDFRERIRINGEMITREAVVDFVTRFRQLNELAQLAPSFFELTVSMAFDFFAGESIDVAVVEVGLGGRLDSTNIILPDLSIITNISFDHTNLLGFTLREIAVEKAGIIKSGVPVVIGEMVPETQSVFLETANKNKAPIIFAENCIQIEKSIIGQFSVNYIKDSVKKDIEFGLTGDYQRKNLATILVAIDQLRQIGYSISDWAVKDGLLRVCTLTGFLGRWQIIQHNPLVVFDTGHNQAGIEYNVRQLQATPHSRLLIVIGMVNDKAIDTILALLPRQAEYFFTQASVERALDAEALARQAQDLGLKGEIVRPVSLACQTAFRQAGPDDLVFVGGSTFIVAEALSSYLSGW